MKIKVLRSLKAKEGVLFAPVFSDATKVSLENFPKEVKSFLELVKKNEEFKGKKDQFAKTYIESKTLPEKLILKGFGKIKNYTAARAREMGALIGKVIADDKAREFSLYILPEMDAHIVELLEGLLSAQYKVDAHKSKKKKEVTKILNLITGKNIAAQIKRAETVNRATGFVKNLVNWPANIVDADYLAKEARRIARKNNYKVAVFGNKELKKMGWGLLLGVNQGTSREARCLVLEYNGGKRNEKPIVLVGKGVIFDTGGYNLKPTNYIETMHQDMAGGATVLGVFEVLKELGIKKNVIGVIPAVENLIDGNAYRPSDILKSYSGKTVEVTNTDAEGRLILADAITYGVQFKPSALVTIATLTGAVGVALGSRYAGILGNNVPLRNRIRKAGLKSGDLTWPLPLPNDYKKRLDSKVADLRNHDLGREAGSSLGAAFLERFVEGTHWCHIDIGGTAFTEKPKPTQTFGATAHGLKLLLNFLES